MRINISEHGAQGLESYAMSLLTASQEITNDTQTMLKTVNSDWEELAPIAEDLMSILVEINETVERTDESVLFVSNSLKKSAEEIRNFIADRLKK